jgi:Asp/Glu/hydantoin racemase
MRILLLNPNMTRAMTDQMAAIARSVAGDQAKIIPITATRGFPYIASRAEAQIAGGLVLEMIADNLEDIDAVIIAAFGDPGLIAARELFDLPIIGMAEAAILSAAMLGEKFSIVTFTPLMARWYSDCVQGTGMGARFTGVRTPEAVELTLATIKTDLRAELIALSKLAVTQDGADVVIMGGAPLAGLAQDIGSDASGVLLDPITAATAQAIAMVSMAPSFDNRPARPAAKTSVGLGAALSNIIGGEALT